VEAQRQLKHALGRIPSPHQPDGLTARLLTLSSGPGLSPGPARVARSVAAGRAPVAPFGVAAFAATSSPRSAAVVADRGRSRPFLLTGIALGVLGGGLALGLGSVDSAGSGGGSGPVVSPVFTSFNTGELPPMTTRYVDPDLPVVATLLGR
jgi:hypothetical protein